MSATIKKIVAISSGGGHWVQLLRLRPAFEGHQVTYITVNRHYQSDVPGCPFRVVPDATRWDKLGLVRAAFGILWVLVCERPHVVVSTGAAPGYFALRIAKWLGARTVWVDSIANVDRLSRPARKSAPRGPLAYPVAAFGGDRRPQLQGFRFMIFVTVGSELPFDRMVRTVDDWAREHHRGDVVAQIGPTAWLPPSTLKWVRFLDSDDFSRHLDTADLIVSHAGMGSILSALYRGKPILVMPRRGDLRETRNDHQVATARRFAEINGVHVAYDAAELRAKLLQSSAFPRPEKIGAFASVDLLATLRHFIADT